MARNGKGWGMWILGLVMLALLIVYGLTNGGVWDGSLWIPALVGILIGILSISLAVKELKNKQKRFHDVLALALAVFGGVILANALRVFTFIQDGLTRMPSVDNFLTSQGGWITIVGVALLIVFMAMNKKGR